jgi:hypothetical protein
MPIKMRVIEEKQKRGNVSKWTGIYKNILSLPQGKVLEIELSSRVEAVKLRSAIYTYAARHNFKVSGYLGEGAILYIERIDE